MMTLNKKLNYSPTHKSIKNHLYCSVKIMNNKFTGKKRYNVFYFVFKFISVAFFCYYQFHVSFNHMMHSPQPTVKHVNF